MPLTPAQLTQLRTAIAAHPTYGALPHTGEAAFHIAAGYQRLAVPTFWVYKTSLAEQDIYERTSDTGSTWDWTTYMQQTVAERDAWTTMLRPGVINPSLAQTRAAFDKIFAGTGAAVVAQRAHLQAMARRAATESQQLFATGAGTPAAPAVMGYEPAVTASEIEQAWALP